MKISIMKNNKTTFWDEVVLGLISFGCMIVGGLLIAFRPSIWIIDSNLFVVMGALIIILGVFLQPLLPF